MSTAPDEGIPFTAPQEGELAKRRGLPRGVRMARRALLFQVVIALSLLGNYAFLLLVSHASSNGFLHRIILTDSHPVLIANVYKGWIYGNIVAWIVGAILVVRCLARRSRQPTARAWALLLTVVNLLVMFLVLLNRVVVIFT